MSSVTFLSSVGGDNSTVTDDADPNTGLANGGHRTRFVPSLAQVVAVAAFVVSQAASAAASAVTAANSPGTNATTTSSVTVSATSKTITLAQTGKAFAVGQRVNIASAANALNQVSGIITAYNSGTGSMTVNCDTTSGSGTFTDGIVSLSASAGIPSSRTISTSGLATGGGDLSANRTINVPAAGYADVWAGTDTSKALTSGAVMTAAAPVSLQYGASISTVGDANLDMSKFINGEVTLTGNTILPNPINLQSGDSGRIKIVQDSTGSRLLSSWGSFWHAEGGKPTLSTTPGAVDWLYYDVVSSTYIVASLVKAPSN
jgi:hypothetical protein